jgi:hypothetical protein
MMVLRLQNRRRRNQHSDPQNSNSQSFFHLFSLKYEQSARLRR